MPRPSLAAKSKTGSLGEKLRSSRIRHDRSLNQGCAFAFDIVAN
jgi:hypothetical protein